MTWVIVGASTAIGALLAILGGGGSVLTVPLLVYGLGRSPARAVPISLFVVAVASALGLAFHARAGRVCIRTGLTFGASSMLSAYAAGAMSARLPGSLTMALFGGLMLVVSTRMLRPTKAPRDAIGEHGKPHDVRTLLVGLAVGVLTGLLGAGGGFVVVPALVLRAGLPMERAVATSLLVILMQSLSGLLGHVAHGSVIDWQLASLLAVASGLGSLVSSKLFSRVDAHTLRRAFAAMLLVAGLVIVGIQLGPWISHLPYPAVLRPLGGGILLGSAAGLLWITNGRIAGISGIAGGMFATSRAEVWWRAFFIMGMLCGGLTMHRLSPRAFQAPALDWLSIVAAGLLVGVGTSLANGCTSGHGVCGVTRLSLRSLIATAVFIAAGVGSTFLFHHVLGAS
ncbi:MAG: TSUP family transporter [Myxococcales bacterium]